MMRLRGGKEVCTDLEELVDYIKLRLAAKMMDRYVTQTRIIIPNHDDYVKVHSSNTYAKIVNQLFAKTFVNQSGCANCGEYGKNERCHPKEAPRPFILRKALENVSPKVGHEAVPVLESDIIIEFIQLHTTYGMFFMCKHCHRAQEMGI